MTYTPENDGPHWVYGPTRGDDVRPDHPQLGVDAARTYEAAREDLVHTMIYAAENGEVSHAHVAADMVDLMAAPPHGEEDWHGTHAGYGLVFHDRPAADCRDCVYIDG